MLAMLIILVITLLSYNLLLCSHYGRRRTQLSIELFIIFTVERECDFKLSFLDIEIVHHSDGSLTTKVYRKTTHTDKYLSVDSHHLL